MEHINADEVEREVCRGGVQLDKLFVWHSTRIGGDWVLGTPHPSVTVTTIKKQLHSKEILLHTCQLPALKSMLTQRSADACGAALAARPQG